MEVGEIGAVKVKSSAVRIQTRIQSVQYLRGLAALGVVFCHYGAYFAFPSAVSNTFSFGQAGVYVFFLISGFIIIYSLQSANYEVGKFFTFLFKRSIRIDPSYYVTILLLILLFKYFLPVSPVTGKKFVFIPQQLFAHLLYILPFTKYDFYMHVFWTLCIEFQFYILIGLLYFLSKNSLFKVSFVVLFGLSSFIRWPDAYYLVFNYGTIFALGISLVTFYQNKSWLNGIIPLLLLALIWRKFGIPIFVLITISSLVVVYYNSTIRLLDFLGNISYSLYLTHTLALVVFLALMNKFHFNMVDTPAVWLGLEVLSAIAVAYVFYLLVERPSQQLSKKLFYKKTSQW